MKNTKIEWAHHTVNFWWGCTKVSPACAHCYAETLAKMWSKGRAVWGANGARWLRGERATEELLKLDQAAAKAGVRWRVFINSMSDTFEDRRDLDLPRGDLFKVAGVVQNLDILLLTKRPECVVNLVPLTWLVNWPAHVWVGTTVENQEMADARIPRLLEVPAKVRFLSCEPLLGPVEFSNVTRRSDCVSVLGKPALAGIHWVICGGESGGKARPMKYAWAKRLRDQCAAAGVPFFFKQWGEFVPMPGNVPGTLTTVVIAGRKRRWQMNGEEIAVRVGKKEASRMFDGIDHNAVPEVCA